LKCFRCPPPRPTPLRPSWAPQRTHLRPQASVVRRGVYCYVVSPLLARQLYITISLWQRSSRLRPVGLLKPLRGPHGASRGQASGLVSRSARNSVCCAGMSGACCCWPLPPGSGERELESVSRCGLMRNVARLQAAFPRAGSALSSPLLTMAAGLLACNLGLLPAVSPAYDTVNRLLLPLSIPLLLLDADLRKVSPWRCRCLT
jgi:hypothetical protein